MYNPSVKEDYLKCGAGAKNSKDFRTVANQSEAMETCLEKDLAFFTRDEVIKLVNSFELTNPTTIKGYLAAIRAYQISSSPRAELTTAPISKEEIDIVTALKKHFYNSYRSVRDSLEKGVSLVDGYAEPAALTLAWLGVPFSEVCILQADHVDLLNGVIARFPNRDIILTEEQEALQVLRMYANTAKSYRTRNTTYEVYQPNNNPYFLHAMVPKGSIDKEAKPMAQSNLTSGFTKMSGKAKESGYDITYVYTDILRSGELYRIYLAEKSGLAATIKTNEQRVCSMISTKMPYYDLIYQYKKYKQAFNLY